jgi:hypothetical protein
MQDAAYPNIDGFRWRDTSVSSTQLNRLFGTKGAYLHLEKPKFQEVFLLKTYSIFTGNQCARCSCF